MNELFSIIKWRKYIFNFMLAGFAVLALCVALLINSRADVSLHKAQNLSQQQQNINREAERQAAVLNEFIKPYKELQQQGIIGQPQRLQWIETAQSATKQYLIPSVNFSLWPTTVATAADTLYTSETLQLKITPMQLTFSLLHEGDFYRLMKFQRAQSKGVFSAQTCTLSRAEGQLLTDEKSKGRAAESSSSLEGFKGQCNLLWYSLSDVTLAWEVAAP